jgi:hypothetical protein
MFGCKAHYGEPALADPQAGTPNLVPPYGSLIFREKSGAL